METGVETRHLRHIRHLVAHGFDRGQIVGLMERRQRRQRMKVLQDVRCDDAVYRVVDYADMNDEEVEEPKSDIQEAVRLLDECVVVMKNFLSEYKPEEKDEKEIQTMIDDSESFIFSLEGEF